MKSISKKLLVLFLFHILIISNNIYAQSFDGIEGIWKGEMQMPSVGYDAYSVILEFKKVELGSNLVGYEGTAHCSTERKFIGHAKKVNFKFQGILVKNVLHLNRNHGKIVADLEYSIINNVLSLKGPWYTRNYSSTGYIKLQRELSTQDLMKLSNTLGLSNDYKIIDYNEDGQLSDEESTCLKFTFSNAIPKLLKNAKFIMKFANSNISLNADGVLNEKTSAAGNSTLSFSILPQNISSTDSFPFKIYLILSTDTLDIYSNKIKILKNSNSNQGINIKGKRNIAGIWLADYGGGIYNFKNSGYYSLETFSTQNKNLKMGMWKHHINTCNQKEYLDLLLSSSNNGISDDSKVNKYFQLYDNSDKNCNDDHICGGWKGSDEQINGIFSWYKFEDNFKLDDSLSNFLNFWVVGKWKDPNITSFNFKQDHTAVQYNNVNFSDVGNWFWTYRMEDGKVHYFLWMVLGRVLGTTKYEVSLEQSSLNMIYIRDAGINNSSFFPITRDDDLVVPEFVLGRLDEALTVNGILKIFLLSIDNSGNLGNILEYVNNYEARSKVSGEYYSEILKYSKKYFGK